MTRRGRKPLGAQLVDRLEGSAHAKIRLKVVLETLAGRQTIPEACETLGIQESMLHRVRSEVLQMALERLEPRPLGRPPLATSPEDQRVAELEDENLRLQAELRGAEIRRELAEQLPRVSKPAGGPGKETTHSAPRSRKRAPREPHPSRIPETDESKKSPRLEGRNGTARASRAIFSPAQRRLTATSRSPSTRKGVALPTRPSAPGPGTCRPSRRCSRGQC
jgi:hypothetical protein